MPRQDVLTHNLQTKIIHVDSANMKVLGSGAVNQVYTVSYTDGLKEEKAVFKPDSTELGTVTLVKEQFFGTAAASGIPPGTEAHLSSRAVASSVVDRLLYGDRPISVKTEFVVVNGQRGILMQKAEGTSPKVTGREVIDLNAQPHLKEFIEGANWNLTSDELQWLAADLGFTQVAIAKKGNLVGFRSELSLDPNNPTTAEGLVKLQVLDIITGQTDRHPGNYFIDRGGNVTGIDQDCSFGVNALPKEGDVRAQPAFKLIIPNNASLMLRMPPVITSEIKQRINDLHSTPDKLRTYLAPLIAEAEIEATLDRLNRLHAHINNEAVCRVMGTREELLSQGAQESMDTDNSYLKRELFVYDSAKKGGWNYLREWRER